MKKIAITLLSLCLATLAYSQTNTFPTTGNAGIGVTNPTTSLLEVKNINTTYLQGLNIQLTGVSGFVVDQTYGAYVLNNMGGSQNGPSRYGGYFEAKSYGSSSNFNYGLVGVGNKVGGYGYQAIGVLGIAKNTYSGYSTTSANLIGVKGLVEFTNDSNTLTNTTFGASLYGEAVVPGNKTLTTYYGLYLKTPTGTITNKWGIYQSDLNSKNFIAGNVGIGGTASPNYKLDVVGQIHSNDRIYGDRLSASGGVIDLDAATGSNFWQLYNGAASLYVSGQLGISQKADKVGIGTTNPTEKLSVDGTVLAKKVRVSTNGADWPDYVFASTYKLRPLNELEDYIQKNQHLPEVPSATEVETDGLDLGDMDATLLKKVEELTLYMIELNKTVKAQGEKIKALEKENKALKVKSN
ncbi:hypothetical protein [Roseivirga sp. E12]|uniref:hypothetical protein n=1 Tax=Roseivirga sp. E12 TaxID=2819237 RepID=UPI001ABCEF7D|nr:hypothetical protein [Roseivirga sp. E12]MBO3700738.1 hypothetical protein [Roseivirga sp. E12]